MKIDHALVLEPFITTVLQLHMLQCHCLEHCFSNFNRLVVSLEIDYQLR